MFVRLGMPLPYLFIATFAASLLAVELIKANPKLGTKQAPSKTFSSFAKKLRRQSQNPFLQEAEEPDFGESSQQSLVHHPNILPQLELVDIETFCFGNVNFLSLGSCSSTFLRCGQFSERRQYDFEECPLGEIFHNTRCRPAFEVKDCFNTEVNLLNDATEKLAQTTNFCARSPFESALYSSSPVNGPDHKCSRQAMLCRNSAPPLALSCSSEQVLDTKTLRCVDAPQQCSFVSSALFAP